MDKKYLKKLKEESDAYEELKAEPPFSEEEFTKEIAPLLEDYFNGTFKFDGHVIVCEFENGQIFHLKAEEIKKS